MSGKVGTPLYVKERIWKKLNDNQLRLLHRECLEMSYLGSLLIIPQESQRLHVLLELF